MAIDYHGRVFRPLSNTAGGQVTGGTIFRYSQAGNLLTAHYSGGGIRHGQMTGTVDEAGNLEFCYHHLTDAGELRSGICRSRPALLPDGRIRLEEEWRWTYPEGGQGRSVVEEIAS